jgi:hypothetical protein
MNRFLNWNPHRLIFQFFFREKHIFFSQKIHSKYEKSLCGQCINFILYLTFLFIVCRYSGNVFFVFSIFSGGWITQNMRDYRDYTVSRVPEFLSLRLNWLPPPPPPHPQASVAPPPTWNQKGGNTHLRVRGQGELLRTTGEKAWHSVYCVIPPFKKNTNTHLPQHPTAFRLQSADTHTEPDSDQLGLFLSPSPLSLPWVKWCISLI